MAHIDLHGRLWRAQVFRKGIRDSATFKTKEEAETWAKNVEAQILGEKNAPLITLNRREMFDLYARSKERARAHGLEYHLTRDDVATMFTATNGRCAVSGIAFNRFRPPNSTKRPWYPSLDRIDSSKPYTLVNCRFVCVAVNVAMGEWGEWVLKSIVKAISSGEPVLCEGPEAPPYSFPPVSETTYRQRARRRQREKSRQNPDNQESTTAQSIS